MPGKVFGGLLLSALLLIMAMPVAANDRVGDDADTSPPPAEEHVVETALVRAAAASPEVDRPGVDEAPQSDAAISIFDAPSPATTDRPVTDRGNDRRDPPRPDRCFDVDRVVDVCCPDSPSDPLRCRVVDHRQDLDVRQLIVRLINAREWEKLFRLLHGLGVI